MGAAAVPTAVSEPFETVIPVPAWKTMVAPAEIVRGAVTDTLAFTSTLTHPGCPAGHVVDVFTLDVTTTGEAHAAPGVVTDTAFEGSELPIELKARTRYVYEVDGVIDWSLYDVALAAARAISAKDPEAPDARSTMNPVSTPELSVHVSATADAPAVAARLDGALGNAVGAVTTKVTAIDFEPPVRPAAPEPMITVAEYVPTARLLGSTTNDALVGANVVVSTALSHPVGCPLL